MRERPFDPPHGRDKGDLLGSVTLPRRPDQVAVARRFVAWVLGDHPKAATAVQLTSEAVTNSVVHTAGASVTVTVLETPGRLRVEVTDEGADTVPTLRDGGDLREDGRGVFLLQRLPARSGFTADERGLTVWFEL